MFINLWILLPVIIVLSIIIFLWIATLTVTLNRIYANWREQIEITEGLRAKLEKSEKLNKNLAKVYNQLREINKELLNEV